MKATFSSDVISRSRYRLSSPSKVQITPCYKNKEEQGRRTNDKRNGHGAVGKSSSEQHFRKSAAITFIMWNFWSPTPSGTGSYGRLAGWLTIYGLVSKFWNLAVGWNIRVFALFNWGTASLRPNQCIPAGIFGYKPIGRLVLKCEFFGSRMISDQSLLLSTNVLNDSMLC